MPLWCGVGGIHRCLPTSAWKATASTSAVIGQGEETLREIVERRLNNQSLAGCPGTLVRSGSEIVRGAPRTLRDLNDLPAHDYAQIEVERYFALKGKRQLDYISSQGCRFRCAFCADPAVYARGWTGLFPERIADEIAALDRQYGIEELAFQDETFFTHAAANRSPRRRAVASSCRESRGRRHCGPIRRAAWGVPLFEKCVRVRTCDG